MRYIYLLPLGNIDKKILKRLSEDLSKRFNFFIRIVSEIEVPDYIYDKLRKQYDANKILTELNHLELTQAEKILGVCDVDLFSNGFNFIFGEAETPGNVAVVSLYRLNHSYKNNFKVVYGRILKEATHELGHTFGLSHCPDIKCVMHFSNTVEDTDLKNDDFCGKCKKLYKMMGK